MVPLGLSATKLARGLRVPVKRITVIVNERGGISADMARSVARYFKTTAAFWMNLQAHYDLVQLPDGSRCRSRSGAETVWPERAIRVFADAVFAAARRLRAGPNGD
jgi:addiction module HigA family antidote